MITIHERAGFRIRFKYPVKERVRGTDYSYDIRCDYEFVMQALAKASKAIPLLQEVRVTPDLIELTVSAKAFDKVSANDQLNGIALALVHLGLPGRQEWEP